MLEQSNDLKIMLEFHLHLINVIIITYFRCRIVWRSLSWTWTLHVQ